MTKSNVCTVYKSAQCKLAGRIEHHPLYHATKGPAHERDMPRKAHGNS